MPARRIPCEYCNGTGLRYGQGYIDSKQAAIDRIVQALADDDHDGLQREVGPPAPAPKKARRSWWIIFKRVEGHKQNTAANEVRLREKALRVLGRLRTEVNRVDAEQGPCMECNARGYTLEHAALGDLLGRFVDGHP